MQSIGANDKAMAIQGQLDQLDNMLDEEDDLENFCEDERAPSNPNVENIKTMMKEISSSTVNLQNAIISCEIKMQQNFDTLMSYLKSGRQFDAEFKNRIQNVNKEKDIVVSSSTTSPNLGGYQALLRF